MIYAILYFSLEVGSAVYWKSTVADFATFDISAVADGDASVLADGEAAGEAAGDAAGEADDCVPMFVWQAKSVAAIRIAMTIAITFFIALLLYKLLLTLV